jgi:hypothetical protein
VSSRTSAQKTPTRPLTQLFSIAQLGNWGLAEVTAVINTGAAATSVLSPVIVILHFSFSALEFALAAAALGAFPTDFLRFHLPADASS